MEETPRNGGPDEGMWTSHYLEGMGYKCITGSTSRSLGSDSTLILTGVQIKMNIKYYCITSINVESHVSPLSSLCNIRHNHVLPLSLLRNLESN